MILYIVTLLCDEMKKLNIPYTFDAWDDEIALPQFIGEIMESPTNTEDGLNEYKFILTGYATSYSYLFGVADKLKSKYKTSCIVNGVVIKYDNTIIIDNTTDDLKQIQITFSIKEWSV